MRHLALACLSPLLLSAAPQPPADAPAPDLILHNARVWTAEDHQPWAQAVAIRGDRIVAVGKSRELLRSAGPATRTVDLAGRMVTPGFIDGHTHFENATGWFFEVRLIDVTDRAVMVDRLKAVAATVPREFWITGVEWGGLAARRQFSRTAPAPPGFEPTLAEIDAVTPDRPVMFRRHDGAVFANSEALRRLRIVPQRPDPGGGAFGRDPTTGALTGMLYGTAAASAWASLPPRSERQTLVAARALVAQLNAFGITGIHDIARAPEASERSLFRTHVERSHSNLQIFRDLRAAGDLTVRVHPLLTLRNFAELKASGITPGSGDDLIRYGGLKGFIDGNLTFDPWRTRPQYSGDFTMRVVDEQTMRDDVVAADRAGFDVGLHAFGDKAHWLMLNWYEAAAAANPPRDRRMRLIHAFWLRPQDIARAGRLGAVADITPWHMITGVDQSEALLTPELQKTAFAWRSLMRAGVRINIVSDMPGDFDRTEENPLNPLENIYYAVTRHRIGDARTAAWHPAEALTVEQALRAYTINPAWTSHEEAIKGSLAPGKLADLVVLSQDVTRGPPEALLSAKVVWTLFAGRTVAGGPPVARQAGGPVPSQAARTRVATSS